MNEDLSKLPKWARDRIDVLERDLAFAQEQLDARDAPEGTPITWSTLADHKWHGLHAYATVRFVAQGGWIECNVTHEGELAVRAEGLLVVQPRAGNMVILRSE